MRWIVDVQTDINIPTAYILPNILIGFAIGNYPFKDINGYGGMVLMRAGKKPHNNHIHCKSCKIRIILYQCFVVTVYTDTHLSIDLQAQSSACQRNTGYLKY